MIFIPEVNGIDLSDAQVPSIGIGVKPFTRMQISSWKPSTAWHKDVDNMWVDME